VQYRPISQLYGHIIGIHRRIGGERGEGRWSREGGKRGGKIGEKGSASKPR